MNTGFHPGRTVGHAAAFAVARVVPVGSDYERRWRPMSVAPELRGASSASEFLERIYERDRLSPLPEAANADPTMEALDLLLVLQAGWDGRKAPAPSREAIRLGRQALEAARGVNLSEARVSPDVEGGVAVYFFGGGRHNDGGWNRQGAIMVSNDTEASLYLRDRAKPGAEVADINADPDGLGRAIERIRQFIVGS